MAVRLVTGPAGSGKTAYGISRLLEHDLAAWGKEIRYVVPTIEMARQIETRLMNQSGLFGILGNVVTPFYNLAKEYIGRAGFSGQLISDIQKTVMLKELVQGAELDHFRRVADYPGFIDALGEIIGELKISLIQPDELEAALRSSMNDLPKSSIRKITEAARLYLRYQNEILVENGLHDREGLMWRALEVLKTQGYLGELKCIIFDGFSDLQAVQREFISAAVEKNVPEVIVTLTYEPGRPEVFEPVESARQFILSLKDAIEIDLGSSHRPVRTSLGHIKSSVFASESEKIEPDESVTLIEGGSPGIEVELVADEIIKLTRDSGYSYSEIGIVARNIGIYQSVIERVFRAFGIPVETRRHALAETAYARLAVNCIDMISNGWGRSYVFRALKSELLDTDLMQACKTEVDAKQLGILGGRENWLRSWGEADETHEFRTRILSPLAGFEDKLDGVECIEDCIECINELLGLFMWRMIDDESLAEDSAAAKAVAGVLAELWRTEQLIGKQMSPAEFLKLLRDSIVRGDYRVRSGSRDSVRLVSASALGGQKFRAVFVIGMLEKVFPRQIREESFFRDFERAILNNNMHHKLRLRLPQQGAERLIFHSASASATDRLYISYPLADESAKDSLPSFYIDEVKKLFSVNLPTVRWDVSGMVPRVEDAQSPVSLERAAVYSLAQQHIDLAQAAAKVYDSYPPDRFAVFAQVFRDSIEKDAVVKGETLLKHLGMQGKTYNCTELESYAACPFMHFCRSTLSIEPVRDEIGALDAGSILHETLFRLYMELIKECENEFDISSLNPVRTIDRAHEILREEFEKSSRFLHLPTYENELQLHNLSAYLKRYLLGEIRSGRKGFIPRRFELEFGSLAREGRTRDPFSVDEPLVITTGDGVKIKIRGKIDRIDISPEGGLVIDYKLGDSTGMTGFKKGLTIQAMVYALALEKVFGIKALGAEYRPLKKWAPDGFYADPNLTGKRGRSLTLAEFDEMLKQCERFIIDIAANIRSGRIAVEPVDCLEYCAYDGVCRMDEYARILTSSAQVQADEEVEG